jgi:hypothetical protein
MEQGGVPCRDEQRRDTSPAIVRARQGVADPKRRSSAVLGTRIACLFRAWVASYGPYRRPLAGPVSNIEATLMRKLIRATLAGVILAGFSMGLAGCSEESSIKQQTTSKSPGGTTTETKETKVQQRGDNPPPPPR